MKPESGLVYFMLWIHTTSQSLWSSDSKYARMRYLCLLHCCGNGVEEPA